MRWAAGGVTILVVVSVVIVWALRSPDNERSEIEGILITAAADAGEGGRVDLARELDFEWDRGYVLGPYTTGDGVRECLGFDWSPLSPAGAGLYGDLFMPNEGFALLVFVRGARDVTGWTILSPYEPVPTVEIAIDDWCLMFSRDAAAFQVTDIEADWAQLTYLGVA